MIAWFTKHAPIRRKFTILFAVTGEFKSNIADGVRTH